MRGDAQTLQRDGRVWVRGAMSETDLAALDEACAMHDAPGARLAWSKAFGSSLKSVSQLAVGLLAGARPVRLVAFNKSQIANWVLPWHQDRVIAVRKRADAAGFSNWTCKSGVWHAEPPIELLEDMMFARVHLDVATESNGCLELALGSHARGKISETAVASVVDSGITELCDARRGDVLFAKALILHRSRPSRSAAGRRALRIDYCAGQLPAPLEWEFT